MTSIFIRPLYAIFGGFVYNVVHRGPNVMSRIKSFTNFGHINKYGSSHSRLGRICLDASHSRIIAHGHGLVSIQAQGCTTKSNLLYGSSARFHSNHHSRQNGVGVSRYLRYLTGTLLCSSFFTAAKPESEDNEKDDELVHLLKMAKLNQNRGDVKKSSLFYHQALSIVQKRQKHGSVSAEETNQALIYIYDNLANLAMAAMQLEEAERLFKETLKGLISQGHAKDSDEVIEISLKLALLYFMNKRPDASEEGFKFCINSLNERLLRGEERSENTIALLGMCLNSYVRFLMMQKRLDDAISYMKETIKSGEEVFGKDHKQVAVLTSDMATLHSMKGDHQLALEFADKAIKIGTSSSSPDLPTYYCNYAYICMDLKEFDEAKRYCKESLALAKKYKIKELEKEALKCLTEVDQLKK